MLLTIDYTEIVAFFSSMMHFLIALYRL